MSNFAQNIKKHIQKEFNLGISRQEKALIFTLMIMLGLTFGLLIFTISNSPKEILLEIPSAEEVERIFEEEEKKEEEPLEEDTPQTEVNATTRAYNQADASLKHVENIKSLDQLLAEQQAEDADYENQKLLQANEKNAENSEKIDLPKPKESMPPLDTKQVNKNALVKFNLEGRNPVRELPNPIYTCESSGKVVVNITVDANGAVIETSINAQQSTSTNGCLTDNALSYARNARFTPDYGKPRQTGTITYIFQPKTHK